MKRARSTPTCKLSTHDVDERAQMATNVGMKPGHEQTLSMHLDGTRLPSIDLIIISCYVPSCLEQASRVKIRSVLSIALLRPLTGQSLRLSLRRHCDVHCVLSFSEIRGVTVKWDDGDD